MSNLHSIPVVLSFTPNYFVAAATCILSILEHADNRDRFHFYCLLKEDLPLDFRSALINLVGSRGKTSFILVDQSNFQGIDINKRFTETAYYRLLLSDILEDIDKVLYLDCDIIVRNDLGALFRTTVIEDFYVAAVKEVPLPVQVDYFTSLGCDPYAYINSGVLLMNLKKIREDNIKNRFIETVQNGEFIFPDQDTINIVCKGKIKFLEPFHNSMRTFYIEEYRKYFFKAYDQKDLEAVLQHGTVHYTNRSKPWNAYAVNFEIWWDYYSKLPMEIKSKGGVNKKMHLFYRIYKTWIGKKAFNTFLKLRKTWRGNE